MEGLMEWWTKFHKKKLQELYVTLHTICLNKLKMAGIGDTCRNCGEEEKRLQNFGEEIRTLQTTWEASEQIRGCWYRSYSNRMGARIRFSWLTKGGVGGLF